MTGNWIRGSCRSARWVMLGVAVLALAACGGGGGGGSSTPASHAIHVTVTGLAGSGLVLQNNGGDSLDVGSNGTFQFATTIAKGRTYNVTVSTQPTSPSQTCTVANASGSVSRSDITNIVVTCATNTYAIRGTASGLAGTGTGVQLQNNGGDPLSVTANGGFAFATPVADGSSYTVTVRAQPSTPSQTCGVANGTGNINGADVTGVQVTCTTNSYLVGGTVTGLTGSGLVLRLNGANNLTITPANRNFTFPAHVLSGASYNVTVLTQPSAPSQTCSVVNGSATMGGANVDNVIVSCVTNASTSSYTIGGTVTGLAGSGLQLQLNGGNTLPISGDEDGHASFTFGTSIADAAPYSVTVSAQPTSPSQVCTVANGSGAVAGANVTNVVVRCATNTYSVGGTITGLSGNGLQLQLNGGNDLTVTAAGGFTFVNPIADGSAYNVTVRTQPSSPSQTCAVTSGSGTLSGGNVTNVQIGCTTNRFPISVTVNGLSGAGLVLRNNGGDDLAVATNGSFGFTNSVASGSPYAVTVATQPTSPSQTCTVANGAGTVGNGAVTNVAVQCAINTYTIGGTISGLTSTGLVLQLNGGNALSPANGLFEFASPIADGSPYNVTVATQPTSPVRQTCSITNGTGTLTGSDVVNVTVTCNDVRWSGIKQFGSEADDVANAVAVDSTNGDVVVVGCFHGALTGTYKNTCDAIGGNARSYLRKFDRTGDFKWDTSLGNSANTQANGVAIDGSGNIYVAGITQGQFDGQPVFNGDEAFLTKYASDGTKLWTHVFGTGSADRANAITFDASGNLYMAGTSFIDNSYDAFVAKFDAADLALLAGPASSAWTVYLGSTSDGAPPADFGIGVATNAAGEVYIAGTTAGSMPGNVSAGGLDVFVAKIDADGNVLATKQFGTGVDDVNAGLATDAGGNVYVAGYTGGSLGPVAGRLYDPFLVRYDASLNVNLGPLQLESHLQDYTTGLAVDPSGNVFITGYTNGNFGFGGGVGTNADPSTNTYDLFVAKYNAAGTLQWTRELGTNTDDKAYAVATDAAGSAFVAGYTLGALDGNVNAGSSDMLVIKYDALGNRQ